MELTVEPEIYSPSIDDLGNYIDVIPPSTNLKNGIKCSCGGSRKNQSYNTASTFAKHTKSVTHQKWLENINNNKSNYYVETITLRKTVDNQRQIIAEKEKLISSKELVIQCLTEQIEKEKAKNMRPIKLIDIDFIN